MKNILQRGLPSIRSIAKAVLYRLLKLIELSALWQQTYHHHHHHKHVFYLFVVF